MEDEKEHAVDAAFVDRHEQRGNGKGNCADDDEQQNAVVDVRCQVVAVQQQVSDRNGTGRQGQLADEEHNVADNDKRREVADRTHEHLHSRTARAPEARTLNGAHDVGVLADVLQHPLQVCKAAVHAAHEAPRRAGAVPKLVRELLEDEAHKLNNGHQQSPRDQTPKVVAEGPGVAAQPAEDTRRALLAVVLVRVVPLHRRGRNHKVPDRVQDAECPEEAEEDVVDHVVLRRVVVGDHNRQVRAERRASRDGDGALVVLHGPHVQEGEDAEHVQGAHPGSRDERHEKQRHVRDEHASRLLDDLAGSVDLPEEPHHEAQEQRGEDPRHDAEGEEGFCLVVVGAVVVVVQVVVATVPEVAADDERDQNQDEHQPHKRLQNHAQQQHVEQRRDDGEGAANDNHLPPLLDVREAALEEVAQVRGARDLVDRLAQLAEVVGDRGGVGDAAAEQLVRVVPHVVVVQHRDLRRAAVREHGRGCTRRRRDRRAQPRLRAFAHADRRRDGDVDVELRVVERQRRGAVVRDGVEDLVVVGPVLALPLKARRRRVALPLRDGGVPAGRLVAVATQVLQVVLAVDQTARVARFLRHAEDDEHADPKREEDEQHRAVAVQHAAARVLDVHAGRQAHGLGRTTVRGIGRHTGARPVVAATALPFAHRAGGANEVQIL
eukprot:Rhum_TRINITY_DN5328_c0_g1::Rhum_TRINITY_DN5328_c0_g1_i1::g.17028::m.17028